jgi:hypothetical protein
MHTLILQELTTIRGGVATVTQQETEWLDVTPYQDAVFYVEVVDSTNSPTLNLQTSPTADESLFASMTSGTTMTAATGPTLVPVYMSPSPTPIARFVRWQITGTPTWDATFRIVVALNSPGL